MVFDLADESGWIEQVPLDEDDSIMDHLKEIFADQGDFSSDESNGISPFD